MHIFFLLLFLHVSLLATVDIAPVDIGAQAGFSSALSAELSTNRGNIDKDQYSLGAKVVYDNNKSYVFWTEFNAKYGQANNELNEQKGYLHARYIHTLSSSELCFELFSQVEYDQFKDINKKLLNGGGLRWNFFVNKSGLGKGYFGLGTYNEYINYLDIDINTNENNWRINSYLAYTKKMGEDSSLTLSLYYQPQARFANDFIFSALGELQIHVYLSLFLSFTIEYDFDSTPAIGVEKEDFHQLTSFVYKF